jgi:16S rRNA (adenine1518-N6/adenine1519-N6)-dimethyltransferase
LGRRLGQHFLHSDGILGRIAAEACPEREPLVVEIGPGRGALTAHLAERCGRLIAIELDAPLIDPLRGRFPAIEVVAADVLATDLGQWGEAVIAGSLPYYITSPILDQVTALGPLCRRAVFLVQKEVALRVAASPGTRDYGYVSVLVQARAEVSYRFTVPPGAFQPPPKVDSAVIRLTPRPAGPPAGFEPFAAACFRAKRKTLRNNLAALYPEIEGRPEARLRAEQLSVAELQSLYRSLIS